MTSPPYCNRYDYTRTYALELALLGVDEAGLAKLRQEMLSCTVENRAKDLLAMNPCWDKAVAAADGHESLQTILGYLDGLRQTNQLNNTGIPRMVRGYFYEMACVIAECARVLKRGAPLIMVNDNVVDVLGRFLNMKVDLYNFVSALNCVLAQRLVRKVCDHCKHEVKYQDPFLVESGLDPKAFRGTTFFEGAGCLECNGTGFHGRAAISELLDLSDKIRTMILDRRPASEIKKTAKDEGMTFLRESALKKVANGTTTLREINKVTFVD